MWMANLQGIELRGMAGPRDNFYAPENNPKGTEERLQTRKKGFIIFIGRDFHI
jgi:hypothetical protein